MSNDAMRQAFERVGIYDHGASKVGRHLLFRLPAPQEPALVVAPKPTPDWAAAASEKRQRRDDAFKANLEQRRRDAASSNGLSAHAAFSLTRKITNCGR
jgi:hypothetical protein